MSGKTTYKDLYTLVVDEIDKQNTYTTRARYGRDQLKRQGVQPFGLTAGATRDASAQQIIASVYEILKETLPNRIVSGLTVKAESFISNNIIVSSGLGTIGGIVVRLEEDVTVPIPFDESNYLFYVNLDKNGISIDTASLGAKLTLAKIIIPNPGITGKVTDTTDGTDNAYIVQYRTFDLYQDENGVLEEDSLEKFRDNIGAILADNIIGNIRLSENLKITNTTGTMELDSSAMKLFDETENMIAKFDRRGSFFYNESGMEIAKFAVDEARIGNIQILPNSIQSTNFVSGALGAGFQIRDDGNAEFNNVRLRGKLTASVFEKDTISTVGGSLVVLDGDVLATDMSSLDSETLTVSGDTTFAVNDLLRMKDGVNDEWFRVTNAGSAPTYTVTRDLGAVYSANLNPAWKKGVAVVNYGQTTEGGIFMTSSESNAPYISIFGTSATPWSSVCTYARLGNLNGFLGYSATCFGIAIGDTNNYLKYDPVGGLQIKGSVIITSGTSTSLQSFRQSSQLSGEGIPTALGAGDLWMDTATGRLYRAATVGANQIIAGEWEPQQVTIPNPPTAGLFLGGDYMGYYNGTCWASFLDCTGNFKFYGCASKYICWDGSDLTVRGSLTADDITAGTLLGRCIKTANTGPRVEMDTTCFTAFNGSSGLGRRIFDIKLSGGEAGDVIIGDTAFDFIRWDDSANTMSFCSKGTNRCVAINAGNITANSICLFDQNCVCCYSCLLAGSWYFHDSRGDSIPYVKRVECGTACTGATICLPGWTTSPKVTVGIKSLMSFNAANVAQNQQWSVYSDSPVPYDNGGIDWGFSFTVHASLVLSAATAAECVKSANFDACVCTIASTCSTCVRMKFQLWCNAACANYYYGATCYAICYRCLGCGVWCSTSFLFTQPHASLGQMQTTTDHCNSVAFPCAAQWEIMAHKVSTAWADSGISSAIYTPTTCTITSGDCAINHSGSYPTGNCDIKCAWSDTITFAGLPASNVFCSILYWAYSANNCSWICRCNSCATHNRYECSIFSDCNASYCIQISDCLGGIGGLKCVCALPTAGASHASTIARSTLAFCTCSDMFRQNTCLVGIFGGAIATVTGICQIICYCAASGSAACCESMCLHSLTDTLGTQTILDSTGCLNWIAVGT